MSRKNTAAGKPSHPTFDSVQILRGVAVLLVVIFHVGLLVRDRFADIGTSMLLQSGAAGVDIFFPISGFVMVISTLGLAGRRGGWRAFAERRIIRIVPLYWLATTLKVALVLAVPALALHTKLHWWHTIASYLFVFSTTAEGVAEPVLPVGWTLNFEMFFYAAFTLALLCRAPVVRSVSIAMILAAGAGFLVPRELTALGVLSPLVLEFVAGMAIARLALAGRVLGRTAAIAVGTAAFVSLIASDLLPLQLVDRWRVLFWGVPGAAMLVAAVSLESAIAAKHWRIPRLIGDASYAIYLAHGFALAVLGVVIAKLGLHGFGAAALGFVPAVVIATGAGIAVHWWVERPVTRALLRWRRERPAESPALWQPL